MNTTGINYLQFIVQLTEWVDGEVINRNQREILSLYSNDYSVGDVGAYLREKEGVK